MLLLPPVGPVHPPAATRAPSGEIAAANARPTKPGPAGRRRVRSRRPSSAAHTRTVLSSEAVTRNRPSQSVSSRRIIAVCTPGSTTSTGRTYSPAAGASSAAPAGTAPPSARPSGRAPPGRPRPAPGPAAAAGPQSGRGRNVAELRPCRGLELGLDGLRRQPVVFRRGVPRVEPERLHGLDQRLDRAGREVGEDAAFGAGLLRCRRLGPGADRVELRH